MISRYFKIIKLFNQEYRQLKSLFRLALEILLLGNLLTDLQIYESGPKELPESNTILIQVRLMLDDVIHIYPGLKRHVSPGAGIFQVKKN